VTNLRRLAEITGARLTGDETQIIADVSHDSRRVGEGTLFAARRMPANMWCDSIFAGVSSFLRIRDSARILSELELTVWPSMTGPELMNEFRASYLKFHSADDFEHRLVLLLNLYKLQILWAAMNYR